ncbi:MAG: methyltransferase [Clostridiales bacterium]|jgi:tRNA1Val (adenine37-N6)-methyltransferase|nr:methyltransferase [Clostridiales bacterium]
MSIKGLRVEDLQINDLKIMQSDKLFRFGSDAVALANFIKVKKGERVLDIGCGAGVIPILLSAKTEASRIVGVELHGETVELARRNVAFNNLSNLIAIEWLDARFLPYKRGDFDVITVNPPYTPVSGGLKNISPAIAMARHEITLTLDDVVRAAANILRPGGRLYIAHRPRRLVDALVALRAHRLEPKTLQFVQSSAGRSPSLFLAEAIMGANPELKVTVKIHNSANAAGASPL